MSWGLRMEITELRTEIIKLQQTIQYWKNASEEYRKLWLERGRHIEQLERDVLGRRD